MKGKGMINNTVNFSDDFPNNNYEVIIQDPAGIGVDAPTNKLVGSFDVVANGTGDIIYLAILNG